MRSIPTALLRRVILPALEVCEFCSNPESEHGRGSEPASACLNVRIGK
jgi:hypothetical protein